VSTFLDVDTLEATDTQSHSGLVRRVNADGRRVYEQQAKLAVVREAMTPGVSLAKVALRHGINANLLRKWVVKHGATATCVATTPALLPVVVAPSAKASRSARTASHERTPIEIELPRGVVRFYGTIERSVLRELIEALSLR